MSDVHLTAILALLAGLAAGVGKAAAAIASRDAAAAPQDPPS